MASDEELMRAVVGGDEEALTQLLGRYGHPLSAFIHRHTGGRDVEDLFQETWLRVVRAAGRFDQRRRFSTWLFQIAVNLCRDWHRRSPPMPIPAEPESLATYAAPSGARVDAQRLLARLPEAQREVILLRYYQDRSERDVSEILGCPIGTVKSRLHNAIASLADIVRDTDDGEVGER